MIHSARSKSLQQIQRHWHALCEIIGERRAGSRGDYRAANYILNEFKSLGLSSVNAEDFPCTSVVRAKADIRLGSARKLKRVEARVLAGSPGTNGRTVEAELSWIEMPEQAERLFTRQLRGKIAVLFGPMPTRADLHRRLVQCAPAAVIHVDDRLPFEWIKDDGVYPAWAKRYGVPPTVTIPFRAAWDFRKSGANRGVAKIDVELKQTVSQNLVAEVRGSRPDLPVIVIGAHHDTQCNNTGADDNASGVIALLELGDRLAQAGKKKPLLRTIRLISFGAEEQLSVGSAEYVRQHRAEMRGIGAVLNLDSVSSPLGHHWLLRAGTDQFGKWLAKSLFKAGLDVVEKTAPMPFADHFPFSSFGIPAVTFMRPNMDSGMRWQHHSQFDDLSNVSVPELEKVASAVQAVATQLAGSARWPFKPGVAPDQRQETRRMAREMFNL